MNTKLVLVGIVAILMGGGPTKAEEPPALIPGATFKALMGYVFQNHGEDAVVTDAVIMGSTKSGDEFSVYVPGGGIQLLSIVYSGAVCSSWVDDLTSGGYIFRWCANRRTVNGVPYEVQKDMYESAGGLSIKKKWLLDCQNSTDFQSMPPLVKALCP